MARAQGLYDRKIEHKKATRTLKTSYYLTRRTVYSMWSYTTQKSADTNL